MAGERGYSNPTVIAFCGNDCCKIVNIALALLEQGCETGLKGQAKSCEDIAVTLESAFQLLLLGVAGSCKLFLLLAAFVNACYFCVAEELEICP